MAPDTYPAATLLRREVHYNTFKPFRLAWVLYLVGFLSLLANVQEIRTDHNNRLRVEGIVVNQFQARASLPQKLVELAVLITARKWTCQHEWFIHEQLARKAGLDGAIIDAIRERRDPPAKGDEALVYDFCRDAHATGRVGDKAFDAVRGRFGLDGAVELLVLSGYYSMMAMVLNSAGLPLPGNATPPLPAK